MVRRRAGSSSRAAQRVRAGNRAEVARAQVLHAGVEFHRHEAPAMSSDGSSPLPVTATKAVGFSSTVALRPSGRRRGGAR
jgi:hypothetical protein